MTVTYKFHFLESKETLEYLIDTSDASNGTTRSNTPAEWTRLGNCQCSNCPLSKEEHVRCPAAVDMQRVVEEFSQKPGKGTVKVEVETPERTYVKTTGIEEGLRSLMGFIMANSTCPILSKNKPMAFTHLPFSSQSEFIIRAVGTYLMRQYYRKQSGESPDWNLNGLIELNQELRLVNQALWQRVHSASSDDSNLKALLSFFTMSSSVGYSLEAQLAKIRHAFMEDTDLGHFEG